MPSPFKGYKNSKMKKCLLCSILCLFTIWLSLNYNFIEETLQPARTETYVLMIGVTLNLIFTAVLAYFLARKDVMWQKTIMVLIVISMYFSGGMILLVSRLIHTI